MRLSNLYVMDVENPQTCFSARGKSLFESFRWQNVKCLKAKFLVLYWTKCIYMYVCKRGYAVVPDAAALNLTRCIIYVYSISKNVFLCVCVVLFYAISFKHCCFLILQKCLFSLYVSFD